MHCILRGVTAVLLCALAACTSLQPRPELPAESALPPGQDSQLDRISGTAEAAHEGQSGFLLLREGPEAFAGRVLSAQLAGRSLDIQTYIWHADLTGIYIADQVLRAADRGVHVRLLVDDMDARAKNIGFAALSAHPNIDIRMFNPFVSRSGTLAYIGEGLTSFGRINHRMHNKTWIADNRIAIAGGRNIGNEYFGAGEDVNFVDLEFLMIGPVVRDASASFDDYWNSASAYPMEMLAAKDVTEAALLRLRDQLAAHREEAERSPYASGLHENSDVRRLVAGDLQLEWSRVYRFVADDPAKVTMAKRDAQRSHVGAALMAAMQASQSQSSIISPYFVPGKAGTARLVGDAQSGKQIRILTNSLIANDVAAVHGGYSAYRKDLLRGGVQLWELKPEEGRKADSSFFGSSGASLHTKAMVIDRRVVFVGSYNLDPRSTWLNCEQGVLVESTVLAEQIEKIFATQTSAAHAWHVTLEDDKLSWTDGKETFDSDPKAGFGRRFQAWIARVTGLESQL